VPVTIKQILGCTQDVADDAIKIDGREASQITFVAQIVAVSESSTFVTYTLEDGSGQTTANFWIEQVISSLHPCRIVYVHNPADSFIRSSLFR
jgi:hypothetical protein